MYIDEILLIKVPNIPETTTFSTSTTSIKPIETIEPITDMSSTSSTPLKPAFYCNFDQTNVLSTECGGLAYQLVSGSVPAYGVLNTDPIYFGALLSHVTDIKSISMFHFT